MTIAGIKPKKGINLKAKPIKTAGKVYFKPKYKKCNSCGVKFITQYEANTECRHCLENKRQAEQYIDSVIIPYQKESWRFKSSIREELSKDK